MLKYKLFHSHSHNYLQATPKLILKTVDSHVGSTKEIQHLL